MKKTCVVLMNSEGHLRSSELKIRFLCKLLESKLSEKTKIGIFHFGVFCIFQIVRMVPVVSGRCQRSSDSGELETTITLQTAC